MRLMAKVFCHAGKEPESWHRGWQMRRTILRALSARRHGASQPKSVRGRGRCGRLDCPRATGICAGQPDGPPVVLLEAGTDLILVAIASDLIYEVLKEASD